MGFGLHQLSGGLRPPSTWLTYGFHFGVAKSARLLVAAPTVRITLTGLGIVPFEAVPCIGI